MAVVRELLDTLPKSHVPQAWAQIRAGLRTFRGDRQISVVWDPQRRVAALVDSNDELAELVRVGRAVYVVALEDVLRQAAEAYRVEIETRQSATPAQRRRGKRAAPMTD